MPNDKIELHGAASSQSEVSIIESLLASPKIQSRELTLVRVVFRPFRLLLVPDYEGDPLSWRGDRFTCHK
jgi:hypothetical protein